MKVVPVKGALQRFRARLADNLDDGTALYVEAVKDMISIQGPPRSLPFNPPHMDTTALYHSYDHVTERSKLVSHAGSDIFYSVDLEFGKGYVAPRPHIIPALVENADTVARECCKPL